MKRSPGNFRRQKLIDCSFLDKIDQINLSERNKKIARDYANGCTYKELVNKYGITTSGIASIVATCIRKSIHLQPQQEHTPRGD